MFNRSGGAKVVVTPADVTPRQTVTAVVTTDEPIDDVSSARLDWGYTNFYRCDWAGRADSAADEVRADCGGDRDAADWVSVISEDLPIATGGEFTSGSSRSESRPGRPGLGPDSPLVVPARHQTGWPGRRYARRFHGRDRHRRRGCGNGTDGGRLWRGGDRHPPRPRSAVYRAGETILGQVTLTPTMDLPDGDLAVSWQRERESHPLTRTPGPGDQLDGRIVVLDKQIALRGDVRVIAVRDSTSTGCAANRGGGALIAGLVRAGPNDVRRIHRAPARTGAQTDRRGQCALTVRPARTPTPRQPARAWGARRCSARTARRPAVR